ncbi:MAG: endonuclease III [Clostridia bacterium]|nr:endonuclease III [Clostridia bacterium]
MKKNERIALIINALEKLYPQAECALNYTHPYELLIATRLSAQCTDERVNKVTPALFKKYPTLQSFAEADFDELCAMVHSCGFFRGKAKSIIEMSQMLIDEFNGIVPDTIEELTRLSGIGRKTANLICGDIYGKPAIIADTHCIRLSNRLGLVDSKNPEIVERKLKELIPAEKQTKFCHNLVHHGRAVCDARKPLCDQCTLSSLCPYFKKQNRSN